MKTTRAPTKAAGQLRWLIVEDALRDRRGHWFEYVSTFIRQLGEIGDEVTTLADRAAEPFIQHLLGACPALPASIWHRMGDGAGSLRRYSRIPRHAWQTRQAIRAWLRTHPAPDLIFVPTVLVHHLLGWTWLIRGPLRLARTRVLLFFPNTPVRLAASTREPVWQPTPTSRLLAHLLRKLAPDVSAGRVILGAETLPMRDALTKVSGVPFLYLPHPVTPLGTAPARSSEAASPLFASYGPARHEKGSDVLQAALKRFRAQSPGAGVRFAVQWLEAFRDDRDNLVARDPGLEHDRQVEFIPRFFRDGEYAQRLAEASALLLPYRVSSYTLRVSRVVIEALVNGLPVVATRGTTLAQQAEQFGAMVPCEDGDAASLATAISELAARLETLQATARQRMRAAQDHFSVAHFRALLVASLACGEDGETGGCPGRHRGPP